MIKQYFWKRVVNISIIVIIQLFKYKKKKWIVKYVHYGYITQLFQINIF